MPRNFRPDNINGCRARSFSEPLAETVLRFIAVSTPNGQSGPVSDRLAVYIAALPELLHFELLLPGNDHVESLIVREHAKRPDIKLDGISILK